MYNSREILSALSVEHELSLDAHQIDLLMAYEAWLVDEALPAGGIGPNEAERALDRHIVDSLAIGIAARRDLGRELAKNALDVGSGAGLPGIPLAIAFPDVQFTLLDRSGRRVTLLKRAVRVLDLEVEVFHGPVEEIIGSYDLVTSRASLPPAELLPHLQRLVSPEGIAVVAGSTEEPIHVRGYRPAEFHSEMLGIRRWMLIMRQS